MPDTLLRVGQSAWPYLCSYDVGIAGPTVQWDGETLSNWGFCSGRNCIWIQVVRPQDHWISRSFLFPFKHGWEGAKVHVVGWVGEDHVCRERPQGKLNEGLGFRRTWVSGQWTGGGRRGSWNASVGLPAVWLWACCGQSRGVVIGIMRIQGTLQYFPTLETLSNLERW